MEKRKLITNDRQEPMALFVEPEGRDYWLLPGETFELRTEAASELDEFEIEHHDLGATVWPSNNMGHISVWASGRELECGHQRPTKLAGSHDPLVRSQVVDPLFGPGMIHSMNLGSEVQCAD